jgi:hypothetical protein
MERDGGIAAKRPAARRLRLPSIRLRRPCFDAWCRGAASAAPRQNGAMDNPRLRVGQAITPEQFEALSDAQLERLVPRAWREYFPGKDFCADGSFYLHDGTAWSFYKGGFVDE